MLKDDQTSAQRLRRERKLQHHQGADFPPLGCTICPERRVCGGLRTEAAIFDCLGSCCGGKSTCDRVCPNSVAYVDRVREIDGFGLSNVPRAPYLVTPCLPVAVPVIFHGGGRLEPFSAGTVAIPLSALVSFREGKAKYSEGDDLRRMFRLRSDSTVVLTGIDQDARIERWWGLGTDRRREIIRDLINAGVAMVTTPNFSLFVDRPRWDDLHSMKRIALVHEEFLSEGMPAALHVNARTERDAARWAEYVADRAEVTHIAFEFTTGTGRADRVQQHATWLSELAQTVARPLHLLVRGGGEMLPMLAATFASVTALDTSAFMKTIHRKIALNIGYARPVWADHPTPFGAPLDKLLESNWACIQSDLDRRAGSLVKIISE